MAKFNIVIVGAGIAGLSMAISLRRKGHDVTVLERHPACQALGGPVALSACATRVLIEYGMSDIMTKRAMDNLQGANIRRYDTGVILGGTNIKKIAEAYGFPSWTLARFRLQETLAEVAAERGVKIRFNSLVVSIDQDRPAVILKDGAEVEADLIIGADGIRAVTRDTILGQKFSAITHFTGYNIDIPRRFLRDDPSLSHLLDTINAWVGPHQVVFASNMPDHGDKINLCFVTEEQSGEQGEWYTLGDLDKLKATYAHFDVTLRKLLDLADPKDCYIWRLSQMPPLSSWVSRSGRVVLAGDSAHAMLPYGGYGANSCIEDSACLAECIDRAASVQDLPKVLNAYEQIRKPRAEWFVSRGRHTAAIWHLSDGEGQEKRDKQWGSKPMSLPDMTVWDGKHIDEPPVGPEVAFHPLINPWVLAFDIFSYTRRRLDQIMA